MPLGFEPPVGAPYPGDAMPSPYLDDGQEIFRPDAYSQIAPPDLQQPPQEPTIEYVAAEPPEPSAAFQKKAFDYITEFCKASSNFMASHIARAERNWKWYRGKLSIRALEDDRVLGRITNLTQTRSDPKTGRIEKSASNTKSDFLYPTQPVVDAITSYTYLSIFSGPDYLTLCNEDDEGEHGAEDLTRQNEVIKELLLKELRLGRFKSNMRPLLIEWVVTGTAIPVTFYYEHKIRKFREAVLDGEPTGHVEEYEETVYECPITQGIKLTRFLPDVKATTTDVNRWRGVGHIIKKTYDEVIQDFNSGYYHLNQSEFEKLFKDAGSTDDYRESPLERDADDAVDTREDGVSDVTLVEWQGKIPDSKRGMIEVVAVIAYKQQSATNDTSFKSGLLIRLSEQTISESGYRTINVCHWSPGEGPVGYGMPDSHTELLYQASQFMGQIYDAASYSCTGSYGMLSHDTVLKKRFAKSSEIPAGSIIEMLEKGNLFALEHPDTADMGKLQSIIQQLIGIVERSSGAEEPTQDVAQNMKATVFSGLQQRSQAPGTVRTQAFAEEVITAAANLSLSFLQSRTFEDQKVVAPDFDTGQDVPMVVTRDDLRRGKWVVEASLTNMDNSQMAAAQIVKDLLLQAPMLKQMLSQENKDFSVAEGLNIILTQTKAPNTNRLVRTLGPREQVLIQQNQQLQQQLQQMQQQMQQMAKATPRPPSERLDYRDVPPSAQEGMLEQAGLAAPPPPPGSQGGPLPQGFGMGGGPAGPEPTDANMVMLGHQLNAAHRAGVPM